MNKKKKKHFLLFIVFSLFWSFLVFCGLFSKYVETKINYLPFKMQPFCWVV